MAERTFLNSFRHRPNLLRAAKIVVPAILGAGCLIYLLTAFEWREIWRVLQRINLELFLLVAIGATIVFWLLRTLRWAVLLSGSGWQISFGKLYLYTAVTVGLANFTTLQISEAIKIEILRRSGGSARAGINIFLIEKSCDVIALALLALCGAWTLFGAASAEFHLAAALFAAALIAAALIFFVIKRFILQSNRSEMRLPDWKKLSITFLLTITAWATLVIGWKFMFQSIAVELTLPQTGAVLSLTTLAGIVSLIPGALGVTEISTAALLIGIGYNKSAAQTGGVLIGLYSLIILLLTLIHWLILESIRRYAKIVG